MDKISKQLYKKVKKMDLGNPVITALVGLVVFYIGLKMFSGGMKSMGNMDHLSFFIHNPYWMFLGGIVMTLLWQSSCHLPLELFWVTRNFIPDPFNQPNICQKYSMIIDNKY